MDGFRTPVDSIIHQFRRRAPPIAGCAHASGLGITRMLLAATLALANGAAVAQRDDVRVQGSWAFTQRGEHNAVEYVATTPAAEGGVWLLVACSRDETLTVSLVHTTQFAFPLEPSSSIHLQTEELPIVSVEGRSAERDRIFLDPRLMRHVMPSILDADRLVISVPERAGPAHDYTFAIRPNDIALAGIRSRCFQH